MIVLIFITCMFFFSFSFTGTKGEKGVMGRSGQPGMQGLNGIPGARGPKGKDHNILVMIKVYDLY